MSQEHTQMGSNLTNPLNSIFHRYTLYENAYTQNINLAGVTLMAGSWQVSKKRLEQLDPYIRTSINQSKKLSIVKYEQFNPATGQVLFNSDIYVTNNLPAYSRDELGTMPREELVEIFRYYGAVAGTKPPALMVQSILEFQKNRQNTINSELQAQGAKVNLLNEERDKEISEQKQANLAERMLIKAQNGGEMPEDIE
jgi:hypothetical protein